MNLNLIDQNIDYASIQTKRVETSVESLFPGITTLNFHLPPELEASQPPEVRGLARDQVRLMVSYISTGKIIHTRFNRLPDFLRAGDILVVNTSGTLNAALKTTRSDGSPLELHLSTHLPAGQWVVELRQPSAEGTLPFYTAERGERLSLPGSGQAVLLAPYRQEQSRSKTGKPARVRLWIADLQLPGAVQPYLEQYGFPIRYKYVHEQWPNAYYQTVYMTEKGSAEMPSAGRAFTARLLKRIQAKEVRIAPLLLHTGVASLEEHEPPYEEYYRIPPETARLINSARKAGKRIIAVGTTVVRALETVADKQGFVHPGEGWTELVITPQRGVKAIDGLLTGLHEPRSTHLAMLAALAGIDHVQITYTEAIRRHYLWHEFGDLHLILSR